MWCSATAECIIVEENFRHAMHMGSYRTARKDKAKYREPEDAVQLYNASIDLSRVKLVARS